MLTQSRKSGVCIAIIGLHACLSLFIPFLASAQTLQPVDSLVIVDANNRVIGKAFSGKEIYQFRVAFRVGERVFLLQGDQNRFEGSRFLVFESSDCSGPPFIIGVGDIILPSAVAPPGRTIYLPVLGSEAQTITNHSLLFRGECQTDFPSEQNVFPVQGIMNLDELYTPPFSVRVGVPGDVNRDGRLTPADALCVFKGFLELASCLD